MLDAREAGASAMLMAFFSSFVSVPLFLFFFFMWKILKKTKMVPLSQIDLVSGNINMQKDEKMLELEGGEKKGWKKLMNFLA